MNDRNKTLSTEERASTAECTGPFSDAQDCPIHGPELRAARQLNSEMQAIANGFVAQVPDKCDRIVWRGRYYHLPLAPSSTRVASDAASHGALPECMVGREEPCAAYQQLERELAQERENRDTAARVACEQANELLKAMGGDPAYSLLENAKRLRSATRVESAWVPVEEGLPTPYATVLLTNDDGDNFTGFYSTNRNKFIAHGMEPEAPVSVTHWLEIPSLRPMTSLHSPSTGVK